MPPRTPRSLVPNLAEPSQPGLILAANVADVSRIVFLYDPTVIEPLMLWADLEPLDQANFLTQLPMPLAGAEGWQTFGLMLQVGGELGPAGGRLRMQMGMPRWMLALQWNPAYSAWEALLEAQDRHRPAGLSLVPWLLVPALFTARMHAFPPGPSVGGNTAAQWLPHLGSVQRKLQGVILGLFALWIHGPTERAAAYRASTAAPPAGLTPGQARLVRELTQLVGAEPLDQIRLAYHPEPGILRLLDLASARLWELEHPKQAPAGDLLTGLLPIARWRPEPPGPSSANIPRSSSELLRWWREWVTRRKS